REGDKLEWGNLQAQVIHTPGHTPGSSCLFLPADSGKVTIPAPQLFAGDTLFAGSIGRTDLWGGSLEKVMDSLVRKLLALPDETVRQPVQCDSQAATLFAKHLLVMLQFVFVFRKCGHFFRPSRHSLFQGSAASRAVLHRAHAASCKLYPTVSAEHNHSRPKIF